MVVWEPEQRTCLELSTLSIPYSKLEDIKESSSLILDESFMMNIFENYRNELPPFKEYWELMYHMKQMRVVCHTNDTSVFSGPLQRYPSPSLSSNKGI
eukprot:scaffold40045_cov23-Cyclotella_meneghiniana.AAC.2